MPESVPVLRVNDLVVSYYQGSHRESTALRGVSFELNAGEFVSLVGESGSGKSTLVNSVLGLLPASGAVVRGSIELSGTAIQHASEKELSRVRGRLVGLVPQDPGRSLNPVKTIYQQISEIFDITGEDVTGEEERARIIELLQLVDVDQPEKRLKQYPHELSGGLKQRILIAIAFGLNPKLIVADEPTSALDVTVQKQVLSVFEKLARDHLTTVLFITHDIALATDYSARILVLKDGLLVEEGTVENVVREQSSEYTTQLLAQLVSDTKNVPRLQQDLHAADIKKTPPVIDVASLTKRFIIDGNRELTALDNVSFTVQPAQTVAIVGESGSGKSTLARTILKLTQPTSGQITFLGEDITVLSGRQRKNHWTKIQLVHQNPDSALDPRASLESIIAEPLVAHKIGTPRERRQRVESLLDQVTLPAHFIEKRPGDLSGGQRQRVAIARALALNAPVLVLDEALSALDVITQSQILRLLDDLKASLGLTYLFISHDLSIVRHISDRVVVLQRGVKVEENDTEALFNSPQDEYTQRLISAIPGHKYRNRIYTNAPDSTVVPLTTAS